MSAETFSLIFVIALLLSTLLKYWLSSRQIRHVARHRDQVPQQFGDRISLASHQRAADYTLTRHRFGLLALALEVLILVVLTLLGGLQSLYGWTQDWLGASHPLWAGVAFVLAVFTITSVLELPLDWYRQFVIEARYGFNRMSLRTWLIDGLKGAALGLALGVPLLAVLLGLMQSAGTWWWLWAWLVWVGFGILMMLVFPTWIAPLFNRFEPLPPGSTRSRVEALLARCGFASRGLFVMDGSKRSSHGNAYFTGIGHKKRIVFFDTLLSRLDDDEVEAVLAHELGHFKHRHVLKRLVLGFAISFAGFAVLGLLMQQPWFFQGLGMTPAPGQAQAPALVLFMLALPAFLFPLQPLGSFFSRRDEFEADRFAARESAAGSLVKALVKLYDDNASTLTPDPLYSAFYDSHPPAMIRIQKLQEAHALSHS